MNIQEIIRERVKEIVIAEQKTAPKGWRVCRGVIFYTVAGYWAVDLILQNDIDWEDVVDYKSVRL